MDEATTIPDAEKSEFLGIDEIGPAFDGLSHDDKLKLYAIEAIRRGGTEFAKGELLREALCRTLNGVRKCPRDTSFIAFLATTMRSIASHSRKQSKRVLAMADPPETPPEDSYGALSAPSPEDHAVAASVLQEIYGHLENDEEATLVVMGWAVGLRGKALRDETGLDQAALDYAAKRIRAVARKLYPNGWKT